MVSVDLQALFGKLNEQSRDALDAAASLALMRTDYNVEIEHWLLKLLEVADSDFSAILKRFEIDSGRLASDLTRVLDGLKHGSSRRPSLSPNLISLAREAWLVSSLERKSTQIRSGHLLCALLADPSLGVSAVEASLRLQRKSHFLSHRHVLNRIRIITSDMFSLRVSVRRSLNRVAFDYCHSHGDLLRASRACSWRCVYPALREKSRLTIQHRSAWGLEGLWVD